MVKSLRHLARDHQRSSDPPAALRVPIEHEGLLQEVCIEPKAIPSYEAVTFPIVIFVRPWNAEMTDEEMLVVLPLANRRSGSMHK